MSGSLSVSLILLLFFPSHRSPSGRFFIGTAVKLVESGVCNQCLVFLRNVRQRLKTITVYFFSLVKSFSIDESSNLLTLLSYLTVSSSQHLLLVMVPQVPYRLVLTM